MPPPLAPRLFLRLALCAAAAGSVCADNPVFRAADPHAVLEGRTVYVYATSGRREFHVYSSTNLTDWQWHRSVFRFEGVDWVPAGRHAWAPAMIRRTDRCYFYYSVGPKPSHVGVAWASSPVGPFTDSGRALLSDQGDPGFEAIDPMVFEDPVSKRCYLYVGGSAGSTLRVFELNDEMTGLAREFPVDNPPRFTEGAFMHHREGRYYLSYSHGSWQRDSYSVHYATSETPLGPWNYRGSILVSDERYKGPGHHSFLLNPATDDWYIFYHRWENVTGPGPYRGARRTAIEKVRYARDGGIEPIRMTREGVGPVVLGAPVQGLPDD